MSELTDEQLDDITVAMWGCNNPGVLVNAQREFARSVIATDRAQREGAAEMDRLNGIMSRWNEERAQRVPDGWKLAPIKPTYAMLCAAQKYDWENSTDPTWEGVYTIMLSAAPAPEPERKPMTDKEASRLWSRASNIFEEFGGIEFVRTVEAFHGITGEAK